VVEKETAAKAHIGVLVTKPFANGRERVDTNVLYAAPA